MCLLIIGNPGSFSTKVSDYLSKDFKLELLEIINVLMFIKIYLMLKIN